MLGGTVATVPHVVQQRPQLPQLLPRQRIPKCSAAHPRPRPPREGARQRAQRPVAVIEDCGRTRDQLAQVLGHLHRAGVKGV